MNRSFSFFFQRLASAKAHTSRFVSANLPCNKFKNRLVNIMPYETTRVCLQPIRGVEGSDYINASFIDGYRSGTFFFFFFSVFSVYASPLCLSSHSFLFLAPFSLNLGVRICLRSRVFPCHLPLAVCSRWAMRVSP